MRKFIHLAIIVCSSVIAISPGTLGAKVKDLEPALANAARPHKLSTGTIHYVGWNQLRYLNDFPYAKYEVAKVKNPMGTYYFYIDQTKDYIKNDLSNGRSWEPHISKLIKRYAKPGSVTIDIGAHIGTHTLELSQCVGAEGTVLAFEPQSKIFRELVMNMSLNRARNVEFYRVAVGGSNGRVEMNPLNEKNEGGTSVGNAGTGQYVTQLSLDALNLTNVSFIKIDVEGMEMDVLKGATKTIKQNKPVMIIEICGGVLPEKASSEEKEIIKERIHYIEGLGYRVKRLKRHWDYLAIPSK